MKRTVITIMGMMLILCGTPVRAETVTVDVNGMVCDFCAQGIIKVLKRKSEVKKVEVDLTAHKVMVTTKPGQLLSDEEVSRAIVDNGFEVIAITREKVSHKVMERGTAKPDAGNDEECENVREQC